jgi:hypothetical protein
MLLDRVSNMQMEMEQTLTERGENRIQEVKNSFLKFFFKGTCHEGFKNFVDRSDVRCHFNFLSRDSNDRVCRGNGMSSHN